MDVLIYCRLFFIQVYAEKKPFGLVGAQQNKGCRMAWAAFIGNLCNPPAYRIFYSPGYSALAEHDIRGIVVEPLLNERQFKFINKAAERKSLTNCR